VGSVAASRIDSRQFSLRLILSPTTCRAEKALILQRTCMNPMITPVSTRSGGAFLNRITQISEEGAKIIDQQL
jgi:hypothetical protein